MKRLVTSILAAVFTAAFAYGQNTIAGNLTVQQTVKLLGTSTPAQLTANVNDYAPTGFSTASTVRLSSDNLRTVTGLAGGAAGRTVTLMNIGEFAITLATESTSSTAGNRFALGSADFTLAKGSALTLWYDGTSSRWRATSNTVVDGAAVDQVARDAAAAAQATANAAETPAGAQAKADAAQAYAVQRANHTGTQAATTVTQDSTHRFATDAEKTTWNAKQDALTNVATLAKITESAGLPLWNGGAWPGGGGGSGTVTSVSVTTANGVSGTVANASTTPAITLSLGAITPSSVAATGTVTGSNLSGTNTGDQTNVTGNAGTATALQTARTINGVSFDGTANITVPAAAGTLTGTTLASGVTGSSLTSAAGGTFGTAAFTNSTAYDPAGAAAAITLAGLGGVPTSRTVNGHALSSNVTLTATDVGAEPTITGGATTITSSNLTASRALVSDSNGKVAVSSVTSSELGYVSGASSNLQTQITNITPVEYYAGTMTVNIGTLVSGTVADLQTVGGTDVDIQEATTTGIQVQLDATGIARLSTFSLYGYYNGGAGHGIVIEFWNWTGSSWETVGQFGTTAAKQWYSFVLNNSVAYLSGTNARMRFRHVGAGAPSHHLILDKVSFNYGAPAGVGVVSASSVSFVPTGDVSANNVQAAIGEVDAEKQPLDTDLTALAGLSTTGLVARTGAGTAATRTITGTANQVTVTNGDGVSGNPTLALPQSIATTSTPQFAKIGLGIAAGADSPIEIDRGSGTAPALIADTQTVLRAASADGLGNIVQFDSWVNGSQWLSRVAGGTRASPTATPNSSAFISFNGFGHDGTSYVAAGKAQYNMRADGLWSGTNTGTYHTWEGTPNGSTTRAEWMRLGNGSLSIGTTSATTTNKLFVNSLDAARVLFAGTTKGIRFTHNSTGSVVEGVDNTGSASYQPLYLGGSYVATTISGTEKMRIDTAGKVGIGTTSPATLLDVTGGYTTQANAPTSGTTSNGVARFRSYNASLDVGSTTSNYIWMQAANATDLSLFYPILLNPNGGNVGVNVSAPGAALDVGGSIGGIRGKYLIASGPLAAYASASGALYMGYSGGAFFRSVSDNAATAAPIDFQVGDGLSAIYVSAARAVRFNAYGAGTLVTDSSGNITASSDRRLKNVSGKFTRGLEAIMEIQPKVFTWKPESGMNPDDVNVGFIAQDVLPAIPEAVGVTKTSDTEEDDKDNPGKKVKKSKRDDAEFMTLSDRPILAALVNAVKELKAKNDELEARIAKLEAKK